MKKNYVFFSLAVLFGLSQLSMMKSHRTTFLENYADLAVRESIQYGIPASIKLAQAIIESNWGTSELAVNANNYFGIKCKNEWQGETYFHIDDDTNNKGKLIPSCFRAYRESRDSWEDHSRFLKYRVYYTELFKFKKEDYISWAKGLKKAGYATDPNYDIKLISVIEQFDLYKYDSRKYIEYFLSQSSDGK